MPFECVALLLQGGGALGSYQAGSYQALSEADLEPDWVAGISIGAINAAIIAGNAPDKRVERLREFWETLSKPPLGAFGVPYMPSFELQNDLIHRAVNRMRALGIMTLGAPGFFKPRSMPTYLGPVSSPAELSFYDVSPLRATLERLVDFDRINAGDMRFSVGAVNVRSGNFVYFDSTTHRIDASHVIASGSLPPGLPATEIDGEFYWDGGIVSNTPLQWVLDSRPRQDVLAFQIDLWNSIGKLPRDLAEAQVREKEIRFSSKTRAMTDQYRHAQRLRVAVANLLKHLPQDLHDHPDAQLLAAAADDKVCTIVQLIYESKSYEGASKDYEFSRRTMEEHWSAGYEDTVKSLAHPDALARPDPLEGVRTFDIAHAPKSTAPSSVVSISKKGGARSS